MSPVFRLTQGPVRSCLHRSSAYRGFSLIELMIAMLIGSLLLVGLVSLFGTTSNVNRLENGLARAQENGRFALSMIASDIRMATATRSVRKAHGVGSGEPQWDTPIFSYVDMDAGDLRHHGLPGVTSSGLDTSGSFYPIPRSVMLRGYECRGDSCSPAEVPDSEALGGDQYGTLPGLGVSAGNRARGADVLTMRYVRGEGVRIQSIEGAVVTLRGADRINIGPSGLVVISDHNRTSIARVQQAGGTNLQAFTFSGNLLNPAPLTADGDIRVSDFDSSFITVTYYLRLDEDPSRPERLISTLVRRENGVAQEIAQGIERLDFRYQLEDANRNRYWMDAAEVNAAAEGGLDWPANSFDGVMPQLRGFEEGSSLQAWRAVRAIDVHLLANTVDDAGSPQEPFSYSFLPDGSLNTANIIQMACDASYAGNCDGGITELPSGLPPGRMARREFRTTVAIRNNP